MQCAPLFLPSSAGHATIENARKYCTRLRYFRQPLGDQLGDHVCRASSLSRRDRRFWAIDRGKRFAFGSADDDARLRSASVDANDDVSHFQRSPSVGAAWVYEERIPTPIVNEVPINTYHGKAMWERVVRVSLIDGKMTIICFANTTKLMAMIPIAMPRIASLCTARRHNMPRKNPPSNAP